MDYGRRGDSLFALAFRKKEDTEELYRALCAAWEAGRESGNFEVRGDVGGSAAFGRSPAFEARGGFGGSSPRREVTAASAGEELWLETDGEALVVTAWANLCALPSGPPAGKLLDLAAGTGGFPGNLRGRRCRRALLYSGSALEPERRDILPSVLEPERRGISPSGLEAAVFNIGEGRNAGLLAGCRKLREYARLIDRVKGELALDAYPVRAVKRAVGWALTAGVLEELLRSRGDEVREILLREYEAESSVVREKQLSYAAGVTEGMARGEIGGIRGLLTDLLARLGPLPAWAEGRIAGERDCERLRTWTLAAARSDSLREFLEKTGFMGEGAGESGEDRQKE